ncbi:DinB family protein [Shewanella sairae]|nr:DinB family protein [Shewanella sairae]
MNLQHHFILMSEYNQRMNSQCYQAIAELTESEINENRGAFFNSIMGTLNHLLVGDLIWLNRFATHSIKYQSLLGLADMPKPKSLDDFLFSDYLLLRAAREKVDCAICHWLKNEANESDFNAPLAYSNTQGVVSKRDFGELVSHLFNHQTHHRGQLSTLLSQINIDIGVTDYLFDIPESN